MTEAKKGDITSLKIPSTGNHNLDVEAPTDPSKSSSSVDVPQNGQQPPLDPTASAALDDDSLPVDTPIVLEATWKELIRYWFVLGWTAFGGPAAHVAMFQKLFVDKLRWCTYLVFTELLMLGQCIPGPTSTQMGFALGVLKKGLSGGLVSGILFQGPGLLILAILGWAAARVLDRDIEWLNGVVAGLAAAGIALVASASVALTRNICKTRLLQVLATAAAVIAYYYPKPWTFPACIIAGGIITILVMRKNIINVSDASVGVDRLGFNKLGGGALILLWVAVLVATIVTTAQTEYLDQRELHWFSAFYRTGSVIFGGGQVVLPMLYNDVVAADCLDQARRCCPVELNVDMATNTTMFEICDGAGAESNPGCKCSWMSGNQFYAGLAISQAMPGPLFNFAAYLGAVIAQNAGVFAIAGIAICWIALFSPGILLIFAILPFWGSFRKWQLYRRALPGLNSTAVGLIIASVFQLSLNAYISSPFPKTSICIGIIAFAATDVLKIPAPLVVLGGAVLGVLGWGADMV
ncbi:hypothetical protein NADE_008667 [Nannochloris sp. 'desiccata']|nr:hypothetical protein KSW81_002085 [Chlorella desiccata (nom. nud.)]KAH7623851.1 hypothetical protein NADE_008667 [Chlorella desiccata (nom. nud.)]